MSLRAPPAGQTMYSHSDQSLVLLYRFFSFPISKHMTMTETFDSIFYVFWVFFFLKRYPTKMQKYWYIELLAPLHIFNRYFADWDFTNKTWLPHKIVHCWWVKPKPGEYLHFWLPHTTKSPFIPITAWRIAIQHDLWHYPFKSICSGTFPPHILDAGLLFLKYFYYFYWSFYEYFLCHFVTRILHINIK